MIEGERVPGTKMPGRMRILLWISSQSYVMLFLKQPNAKLGI